MKKITFFISVLACSFGFAQTNPIDFETGGNGATWTWNVFENDTNPALEFVANPSTTGNTTATVAKFTALQTGNPWAGCESAHGSPLGTFDLTASNAIIKIWVYKPVISDVGIKLVTPSGGAQPEKKVANTLVNQWEELTFDFTNYIGLGETTGLDQVVVFPDFDLAGRTQTNVCYFDQITFSTTTTTIPEPMTAAPTPTIPAANVISMFSNAYTNVAVDTWQTVWSAGTVSDLQIAGNDTKKYAALNFVGIETVGANLIDASSMLYFHIDAWTPNMTQFRIKLVDFGADASFGGGDDTEHELTFTPTLEDWNSYHIALADFTGLTNKNHIAQLILSAQPANEGILYIDNVYFSTEPMGDPNTPMVAAPTPTVPAANVISMFSNAYTNVPVDTWQTVWSAGTVSDLQIAGNDTKKYTALNFVGIETVGANLIDASTMLYFNIDAWTPNMTQFRIKLVDFGADTNFGGGDDTEHELVFTPTLNDWNTYNIPLTDFTGLTNKNHIAQLILSAQPANEGVLYIDNVYFSTVTASTSSFDVASINMYPNPANNFVTIAANDTIETITVSNILGQTVMQKEVNETTTSIDITSLNAGQYFVSIFSNNNRVVKKLIKK